MTQTPSPFGWPIYAGLAMVACLGLRAFRLIVGAAVSSEIFTVFHLLELTS